MNNKHKLEEPYQEFETHTVKFEMIFLKEEKSKISWRKEDITHRKTIDKIKFVSQIHHQVKKDNVVTCI